MHIHPQSKFTVLITDYTDGVLCNKTINTHPWKRMSISKVTLFSPILHDWCWKFFRSLWPSVTRGGLVATVLYHFCHEKVCYIRIFFCTSFKKYKLMVNCCWNLVNVKHISRRKKQLVKGEKHKKTINMPVTLAARFPAKKLLKIMINLIKYAWLGREQ